MRSWALVVLMSLSVLAAACGGTGATSASSVSSTSPGGSASPPPPDHRIVVRRTGGLCPTDDGGGPCEDTVTITGDGWAASGTPTPAATGGTIERDTFDELVAVLDDGFDELTAQPFTDTCPTAYDGQEVTIELWELPNDPLADASVRTTSSCTHDWETPRARGVMDEVQDLLDRAGVPT